MCSQGLELGRPGSGPGRPIRGRGELNIDSVDVSHIAETTCLVRLDCRCVDFLEALVNMLRLHAAILDEAVTAHTTSSYG